jgi:hypothetical protein
VRGRRLWWAPPLLALPAALSFPVGAGALTARPHSQRYVWTFAVEMLVAVRLTNLLTLRAPISCPARLDGFICIE